MTLAAMLGAAAPGDSSQHGEIRGYVPLLVTLLLRVGVGGISTKGRHVVLWRSWQLGGWTSRRDRLVVPIQ
jgi:hypothetical protein